MKLAVLSVAYPAAKPYLKDFFTSVARQTDGVFEFLLVNDGVKGLDAYLKELPVKVRLMTASGTPGALRKKAIRRAARLGYDALVFADADDVMAPNRVEVSRELLARHPLVFNELIAFGRGVKRRKKLLGRRFRERQRLGPNDLMTMNCLGMSNTAARLSAIRSAAEKTPSNVRAFDWALFSHALRGCGRVVFTKRTYTLYRQHAANLASPFLVDARGVLKAAEIKAEHYSALRVFGGPYRELSDAFDGLLSRLKRDRAFRKDYCESVVRKAPADPLWWEPVKAFI